MEGRLAKLRKLDYARNSLPHVSQAALAAFIRSARDGDLPTASSTKDVRAARDLATDVDTPYGKLLDEAPQCNAQP